MPEHHAARPRLVVDNSKSSDWLNGTLRTRAASKRAKCHFPGTRPNSFHLRTVSDRWPRSLIAKSRITGQRASEKIVSDIRAVSENTSGTSSPVFPLTIGKRWRSLVMDRDEYRKGLAERMVAARNGAGYRQLDVARYLGLELDAYRKQEKQGSLPTHLIEPFAQLAGVDVLYLLTGKHRQAPELRRIV